MPSLLLATTSRATRLADQWCMLARESSAGLEGDTYSGWPSAPCPSQGLGASSLDGMSSQGVIGQKQNWY